MRVQASGMRWIGRPAAAALTAWLAAGPVALAETAAPVAPAPAASPAPAACFSPEALAFRPGEQHVRRGVRDALQDPPHRTAAPFSAVPQRGVVRRVELPPGKKLIALTFDLCEQPFEITGYQGDVVDYLRAHKVRATFFAGGKWMLTHQTRAQQLMADPLFEVANHTWEHRNLRRPTGQALIDEIANAQLAYEQVREDLTRRQCVASDGAPVAARVPARMTLFRFPFGACKPEALEAVANQGLIPIQWDVSSGDPTPTETAQGNREQVRSHVRPGSIVLFHANGRGYSTPAALPGILADLRAKGYDFVTVSELLAAGKPVYASDCYDSRPGDTNRYDALANFLESQYRSFRASMTAKPAPAALGGGETGGAAPQATPPTPAAGPAAVPPPLPRPRPPGAYR